MELHTRFARLSRALDSPGGVIHWARRYDRLFGRLIGLSDGAVVQLARIQPGAAVLDLGCGPGGLTLAAARAAGSAGAAYGIDAAPEMTALARLKALRAGANVAFCTGSAAALPLRDESLDVVVSRLVMHHLPREVRDAALAEVRRTLRPGGTCVLVDVRGPALGDAAATLRRLQFDGVDSGTMGFPALAFLRATRR